MRSSSLHSKILPSPIPSVWIVGILVLGLSSRLLEAEESLPLPGELPAVKHPAGNKPTPAKISLGRKLFFDPLLSDTGKISCAACHIPQKGFSNGKRFARGSKGLPGTRNVPTLFNVGYSRHMFWDGRAATLEEQALLPIQHPKEMNMPLEKMVKILQAVPDYRQRFQEVFAGEITAQRVAKAIAAYERTIISQDTPFDRFLRGDKKALSPPALRGMRLFYSQARCFVCHKGPNFTDNDFHNIGVMDKKLPPDPGRRLVTKREEDQGKFITPTLREIGRTAPYMHNGQFSTLKEVVQHYNFGGVTDTANDYRDEQLQVLYLAEDQVDDLVAFLKDGLTTKVTKATR